MDMDVRNILSAVPFDQAWAKQEVVCCRMRFKKKGISYLHLTDDDILSIIGMLWTLVINGKIGKFRPDSSTNPALRVRAYVAKCLDYEIMRYSRQEGSLLQIHCPRGTSHFPLIDIDWLCRDDNNTGEPIESALIDDRSPEFEVQQSQERELDCVHGWPGPLGEIFEHWINEARTAETRFAQSMRIIVRSGNVVRANMAWVVTRAAYEGAPSKVERLAPMLFARWIGADNSAPKQIIKRLYPSLPSETPPGAIAAQESRDLLRFLAVEAARDATVTASHLAVVSSDAILAMSNWVGQRGPYSRKGGKGARSTKQVDPSMRYAT